MSITLALLMIFGLPLLGIVLAGYPTSMYLQFPSLQYFLIPASFSWTAFALITGIIIAACGPIVAHIVKPAQIKSSSTARRPFPWWGWEAVIWTIIWWMFAWTRIEWFRPLQALTFAPLWFGYVVIVNALTYMRTGRSLLTHRPRYLCSLFILSSAFWWSFEYLNRFVQNWHYHGTEGFSTLEYFLHASVSFSTVLPAVISTSQWLATFPSLREKSRNLWPWNPKNSKRLALIVALISGAGLTLLGILPNFLFPLLWMAPLLVLFSVRTLFNEPTIFRKMREGDWSAIVLPALAALICGFFWEMWNVKSLAHWSYTVPFVDRFQLFEMPLLGYAGYLPFGVECAAIAALINSHLLDIPEPTRG